MRFSSDELIELAGFFAKRFPQAAALRAIAADAGVTPRRDPMAAPEDAWTTLLHQANQQGRMRLLAHAAARRGQDDANLIGVCQVITGSTRPGAARIWDNPRTAPALAGAAIALLGLSAFAAFRTPNADAPDPDAPVVESTLAEAVVSEPTNPTGTAPAPAVDLVAVATPSGSTGTSKPWKAGNPLDAARTAVPAAPEAVPARGPVEQPANYRGRCRLKEGGIVGYWYAGRSAPAQAGDTIIMPNSVNVRADYPDTHNDFDARTARRCTLAAGDKVRLTSDPIAVPGGAFWVPLHSGDLLEY